jgi:hypothetical protein
LKEAADVRFAAEPLVHLLITLAMAIGGATLATVSTVMFLRWLGPHWTRTLPAVVLGPLLRPFDQEAAGFVAATAVFATATGARWHLDDLRHGADRAKDARHRTPLDAGRERMQRRDVRGGRWIDPAAWPSGATSAGGPSASRSAGPAAVTRSSRGRRRARRSRRRGSPAASSAQATARS